MEQTQRKKNGEETVTQIEKAAQFRRLHEKRPLVLPNAWDAASARLLESAGAEAIATTSAGVSWSLGRSDGQKVEREQMMQVIHNILRVVRVPVNADIEAGYGDGSLSDLNQTVKTVVEMGVAGINLEDTPGVSGEVLLDSEAQSNRIRAAREVARSMGGDLVINARTDVFLFQVGAPETRLKETVKRAKAYRAAGADCIFVPGVIDTPTISELVRSIEGPVNIMGMPGAPSVKELGALGVARLSVGPWLAQVAYGAAEQAARDLLEAGNYRSVEEPIAFPKINSMF